MSFEESVLLEVMRAVIQVGLDAIVIGNGAAALQGVPVTTQDIDFLVRETPRNEDKIKDLVAVLGENVRSSRPFEPVSRMIRVEGLPVDIDFVFGLSSRAKFESVKSRAHEITIGDVSIRVADLQDVIAAKRAAGRPKDLATLAILQQYLDVQNGKNEDET